MTETGQGRKDRSTRRTGSTMDRTRDALQLLPVSSSVRDARRFVGSTIDGLGVASVRDLALLLTSELVTNAVVHAGGEIRVCVIGDDRRIRVAVEDTSDTPPRRREAGEGAVSGRGLCLVAELAEHWGVDIRDGGKAVWFELEV